MQGIDLFSRRYWIISALYALEVMILGIVLFCFALHAVEILGFSISPSMRELAVSEEDLPYAVGYLIVAVPIVVGVPCRWDYVRYLWPAWAWLILGDEILRASAGLADLDLLAIALVYPVAITWALWFSRQGKKYFSESDAESSSDDDMAYQALSAADRGRVIQPRRTKPAPASNNPGNALKVRAYWAGLGMLVFGWISNIWLAYALGLAIVIVSFCMLRRTKRTTSS